MANVLDQLQFYKHNNYCPRLSASQYKMIYQLHPTSSLLQSLGELGGNWTEIKYYESGPYQIHATAKYLTYLPLTKTNFI